MKNRLPFLHSIFGIFGILFHQFFFLEQCVTLRVAFTEMSVFNRINSLI